MKLTEFKPMLLAASGAGAIIQQYLFPDTEYLIWLCIAMTIDLITGITKVWATQGAHAVTKVGIEKTVIKFIRYGSFLVITHLVGNFKIHGEVIAPLGFVEKWAYTLLILVEVKSVYENIIAVDSRLDFVKKIITSINQALKSKPGSKNES